MELSSWVPNGPEELKEWLAQFCGLRPVDQRVPSTEWDGRYFPAAGQTISEQDAKAFATALNKALPDILDHDIPEIAFATRTILKPCSVYRALSYARALPWRS